MQALHDLRDKPIIKVVTGVRRCGKSTLLEMFSEDLLKSGVPAKQVQTFNLEEAENLVYVDNWVALHECIVKAAAREKMNYVFLDEVQVIKDFEKLLSSLQAKKNFDIYVTGSNAFLLSSELATLIAGRYLEIKLLPFSFSEFVKFASQDNKTVNPSNEALFQRYVRHGGFPQAIDIAEANAELANEYLMGIYDSVIRKDVMKRLKIQDLDTLDRVTRYLFDNVGNITSATNIANVLQGGAKGGSHNTIKKYISGLVDSFIFYRVPRFDLKGKQLLKTQQKYYAVDLGLRSALLGTESGADVGHILENVIYLELLRRHGKVMIGKVGKTEVDFVVQDSKGATRYYQVAYTTRDEGTLKRELAPLLAIRDYNQRYLITMDIDPDVSYQGIKKLNALDFLLGGK
jgi:predicted AAA+ superfamily ATPase